MKPESSTEILSENIWHDFTFYLLVAKLQETASPKIGRRDVKNVRVVTEPGCRQKWTEAGSHEQ